MRDVDVVWKRACAHRGGGVGDRHLSALLLVHGMMMNGGAGTVCVGLEPAELAAAAAACEYLGLDYLGRILLEIPSAAESEDAEIRLNDAFHDLDPDGLMIPAAFEDRYADAPGDFDPVPAHRFPHFGRRTSTRVAAE